MSSVIPKKRLERVAWYAARKLSWSTNHAAIGTTSADVAELETLITAAQTARSAQEVAMAQAKAKTEAFYAAVDAMSVKGANIVKQVRVKGEATNDPDVYELAMIPAPAVPSPIAPPGIPYAFKVELFPNGTLKLLWKCDNAGAGGVVYHVFRRDEPTGQFVFLGGSTVRDYLDATIPAGATQITYQIQGVRPSGAGQYGEFNVNFGANAGGTMTATVMTAPKLAA